MADNNLTESETLELLQLQKAKAMAMQGQQQKNSSKDQSFPDALKASFQQVTDPIASAANKLQPKNLTAALPMAGAMAGTAIAPGVGTAAGAGLGSIAQKMANMFYGTSGPVEPTMSIAGIPLAPKAAIEPMANAALAGIPETKEGMAAGKAISGYYENSIKPAVKSFLKPVGQMMTGKSAAKVGRIMEDPTAVLPESLGGAKSVEDASSQYGTALANDKTPVFHEDGSVTKGVTKKVFSPFSRGHKEADETAQAIWDKWEAGDPVNAQDAYDAKRATDKVWPTVVKERNEDQIRQLSEFKTAMDDVLSSQGVGPFQQASKDYARARLKADFTQILPRTKTGDVSTVKTLLMPLIDHRKIPLMLATSPAVTGYGNLAAQGTMKGLNLLGSDPNIRQALLGILQQLGQKKQPGM